MRRRFPLSDKTPMKPGYTVRSFNPATLLKRLHEILDRRLESPSLCLHDSASLVSWKTEIVFAFLLSAQAV